MSASHSFFQGSSVRRNHSPFFFSFVYVRIIPLYVYPNSVVSAFYLFRSFLGDILPGNMVSTVFKSAKAPQVPRHLNHGKHQMSLSLDPMSQDPTRLAGHPLPPTYPIPTAREKPERAIMLPLITPTSSVDRLQ